MPDDSDHPTPARKGSAVSRRGILLGAGMLAASGAAFARSPERKYPLINERQFEALLPKECGEWKAHDSDALILPPQDDLSRKLYERLLTRVYVDPSGAGVMCLAAYNSMQIDDVQVHRPEVCYRVAGFEIKKTTPIEERFGGDRLVDARIVETESRQRAENMIYWTRVGDEFPTDWTQQRMAMLRANVRGYYPDGLLLRISTAQPDLQLALSDIRRFANALYGSASANARNILFGTA